MRGSPSQPGRWWLLMALVALSTGSVAIAYRWGWGPFRRRPATPMATPRQMRQGLEARGPAVVDTAPGDGHEDLDRDGDGAGDEPWLRDPDGLQPVLNRGCQRQQDCLLDFSYQDEVLLDDLHRLSGRVWIPAAARAHPGRYPLVVLLHGTDGDAEPDPPHRLMAAPLDLTLEFKRAVDSGATPPLLVAAPSQTRDAHDSPTLWTAEGFDLADFVRVLDAELATVGQVRVDRRAVSVFGHSGAGCVVTSRVRNGLFRVAEQVGALAKQGLQVRVLGLMDICFHGEGGGRYLRHALADTSTRVAAMWVEPETWFTSFDRDLDGFIRGLGLSEPVSCDGSQFEHCVGNDRGWWLLKARREVLELGAGAAPPDERLGAHSSMTRWFVREALRRHFSGKIER